MAQRLNLQWLGADISHLAIRLIVKRLTETYGLGVRHNIKMHGLPKDVASAKMLAQETEGGRIGFQDWAIEVMLNGVVNKKKWQMAVMMGISLSIWARKNILPLLKPRAANSR